MTIYKLDKTHKIEVVALENGTYQARLFEKVYNRDIQWVEIECTEWYTLSDLKWEYSIV